MTTLAEELRARRQGAGLSLNEAAIQIRQYLPETEWVTGETIRGYEIGKVLSNRANPLLIGALARLYGCTMVELSTDVAENARKVRDLLTALSPCTPRTERKRGGPLQPRLARTA